MIYGPDGKPIEKEMSLGVEVDKDGNPVRYICAGPDYNYSTYTTNVRAEAYAKITLESLADAVRKIREHEKTWRDMVQDPPDHFFNTWSYVNANPRRNEGPLPNRVENDFRGSSEAGRRTLHSLSRAELFDYLRRRADETSFQVIQGSQ